MKRIIFLMLSCAIIGCSPKITESITSPAKPLTLNDKVAFLDLHHNVPDNATKIGKVRFGDTGFSTDCDFNSNLIKARDIARKNGANIVKVTDVSSPDILSSCYRMEIDFYFYNGDVTQLKQYQLQIN